MPVQKVSDSVLEDKVLVSLLSSELTPVQRRQLYNQLQRDMFRPDGLATAALRLIARYLRTSRVFPDVFALTHWAECPRKIVDHLAQERTALPFDDAEAAIKSLSVYAQKRKTLQQLNKLLDHVSTGDYDSDLAAEMIKDLSRIACRPAGMSEFVIDGRDPQLAHKLAKAVARIHERNARRWATGWPTFDKIALGGLAPGEALMLAANTGGGKSMAALAMASHMAEAGAHVLYLSFEMSEPGVLARLLSRVSGLTRAQLSSQHTDKSLVRAAITTAAAAYGSFGGTLRVQTPDMGFARPDLNWLETVIMQRPTDVVFVDYMSMLSGFAGGNTTEEQRLRMAAEGLMQIAALTQTAVVAMAQLKDDGDLKYAAGMKDALTYTLAWSSKVSVGTSDEGVFQVNILKKRDQSGKSPDSFCVKSEYDNLRIPEVQIDLAGHEAKPARAADAWDRL